MNQNGRKTLMIGLDGATFSVLDPLMAAGRMPFLKSFVSQGVRAGLASTIPPTTPPAWTTIMTGRSPANHGILDFFRPEAPGSHYLRFVSTKQIICETIWACLTRHDKVSMSLNFPVMAPPLPIKGYSVPGFVTWRHLRNTCHPAGLMDTLKAIPGFDLKVIAHDFGLEEKVMQGCSFEESEEWIKYHSYKDQQWVLVHTHLDAKDPFDLGALVLDSPDRLQHVFYRYLDPNCFPSQWTEEERRIRTALEDHYQALDGMMARLVEAAGPNANVFIVSDHGFGPSEEYFYLDSYLAQLGYLKWSERAIQDQDNTGDVSMDAVRNHGNIVDWENTQAYVTTPSSNGISINVRGKNSAHGIEPEFYDTFVNTLKRQLLELRHPKTGKAVVEQVWTRQEAFGGCELAPDLTVRLWDNGLVSTVKSDHIVKPRKECIGVHYPMGVFMAKGPDIEAGLKLEPLSILDVAPAMLHSLGLPIPEAYEGRVPEQIWRSEVMAARPVRFEAQSGSFEQQTASSLEMDEEDIDLIVKRLKGLGYLA